MIAAATLSFSLCCLLAASLQHMITFLNKTAQHASLEPFLWGQEYLYQQELYGLEGRPAQPAAAAAAGAAVHASEEDQQQHHGPQWALLKFDQPLTAPAVSVVVL